MRAFIALEIEDQIKQKLEEFVFQMQHLGGAVRWVRTEVIHLTLKFLGEISNAKATEVSTLLDRVAGSFPAFSLQVADVGTFPFRSQHPRVIWAGISQGNVLTNLHADLEENLQRCDFPREKRTYNPHLTLGRVKSTKGIKPLLSALEKNAHILFGTMLVKQIILFKSDLKPSGAEYSQIHITDLSS